MGEKVRKIVNKHGFTLIEIMIAIFILTVALLGMAAVTVSVINGNAFSKEITTATTLAQDKMEEMKNAALAPGSDTESIYTRTWTVTANSPPIAGTTTIVVTVSWSRGVNAHNVVLRTIVKQ